MKFLVAGSVAALMVTTLAAQSAEQGVVKVVNIHGSARYFVSGDSNPHPLKVGTVLNPGSVIQTAADSYVDVVLNNANATASPIASSTSVMTVSTSQGGGGHHPKVEQDAIRIFENSVLGFDKLTINQTGAERVTETQLDLKHGRIFGTVRKLSASSKYEVKIPTGVAGIRGTVYLLSADGELSVLSSLSDLSKNIPSGSVVLAYFGADGNVITQVVGDGQQFNTHSGQLTPIPESVLQNMLQWAGALGFMPGGFFVEFTPDRTVYLVSPTYARQ